MWDVDLQTKNYYALCEISISAAHFNSVSQQVVLATDEVATVQLVLPLGVRQDMVQSHRNAISGVAYSACFNHLITACRSGVCFLYRHF